MVFEDCFKGKVILVTGAGRGIGRALSLKLDSLGATVWAVSKNPENLHTLKAQGQRIQIVPIDLRDWQGTREALEKIPDTFDGLVNNAGVCPPRNFMDTTLEDIDSICDVNLKAVINVSQVIVRKMIERGTGGAIINISSILSLKPSAALAVYSTLKAGLDQLTKIMAIELGPHKIRVNALNPSGVPTEMLTGLMTTWAAGMSPNFLDTIPLRRMVLEMDEMINCILFYLSDLVPILTGTSLPLDGGMLLT